MENAKNLKCLNCDSERVVGGCVGVYKDHPQVRAAFTANELVKSLITLEHKNLRIEKETEAVLCLECGLVWTSVNVEEATRKLSKYGTDELKSRVGLA